MTIARLKSAVHLAIDLILMTSPISLKHLNYAECPVRL
jgi:hypothetical protein